MATLDALQCIADFIRESTANQLLDKAESLPGADKAPPNVSVGYAPSQIKDMSAYNAGCPAPCVVVGIGVGGGNDDGGEAYIPVMITVGTYSQTVTEASGAAGRNNGGFVDLVNLIDLIRHALMSRTVLARTAVETPVRWGLYLGQPYPYWYGWISFHARVEAEGPLSALNNDIFLENLI